MAIMPLASERKSTPECSRLSKSQGLLLLGVVLSRFLAQQQYLSIWVKSLRLLKIVHYRSTISR